MERTEQRRLRKARVAEAKSDILEKLGGPVERKGVSERDKVASETCPGDSSISVVPEYSNRVSDSPDSMEVEMDEVKETVQTATAGISYPPVRSKTKTLSQVFNIPQNSKRNSV